MTIRTKEEQVKEILRCGRDPVYFIKNYVKIQHPKKGLILCSLYPFQEDCIRDFVAHRFNIIVKARQLGLSTITAAYALWYALFHKDKSVLVIATKLTTAVNFIKKVKVALQSLPTWMVLSAYSTTFQAVKFENRSVITAIPTSEDAGRSEALSLLIVDEAALIKGFDDIWTGLSPTISTGGAAIILSTPYGVGGQYYTMWVEAESGMNGFHPTRLPWDVHPEHDQAWFDKETKNMTTKKKAQEYLCDFLASGDTFLQQEDFEYLRILRENHDVILRGGPDHGLWMWKHPESGHKYIISADVSRGDSNDYSTCHVIDTSNVEVVAEYKGKQPPDKFAEFLMEVGKQYNDALLCPENNTFGYTTCVRLRDLGYPHLYYSTMRTDVFAYHAASRDEIPGFNTQAKSRIQILSKLEEVIRNRVLKIYSPRFYEEIKAFVWNGSRAQALKDSHDDLVMSLAIGVWVLDTAVGYNADATQVAQHVLNNMTVFKRDVSQSTMNVVNQAGPPGANPGHVAPVIGITPMPGGGFARHGYRGLDFGWLMK